MSSEFPLKAKGKLYAGLWVFLWPHERGVVLLQQKTSNNPQKKVWIMKRIFLATVAALVMTVSATAQRLADVRAEATIITDKMIAELGIGPGYRNSILNINLAYLNSINSYRDIDSYGWKRRNREMRRYLSPGQWRKYCNTYYFYRPIGWQDRAYVHHIYRRYPPADRATTIAPATTEATATIAPASTSIMAVRESTTEAMADRESTTSMTEAMADRESTTSTTEAMDDPASITSTTSTIATNLPCPI